MTPAQQPTRDQPLADPRSYQPPRLTALGTLAEFTLGNPGANNDFLGPGSN
ncbi:MAG: lasso RiPP family leader peptide-containing protein [Actinomycetota bacterium]|nr:lasso RiPP family leader peptide-containing protein [Actinomycetota bacterium]